MNTPIKEAVIASYATRGNARRIRIMQQSNGTYSYAEFHKLKLVAAGHRYKTFLAVLIAVEQVIKDAKEIDGINYRLVAMPSLD